MVQVLRVRSLNEAQRLMVVDERLRIVYATDTLAKLLGTSVSALTELSLTQLIPPPVAQLHKRWITVRCAAVYKSPCKWCLYQQSMRYKYDCKLLILNAFVA